MTSHSKLFAALSLAVLAAGCGAEQSPFGPSNVNVGEPDSGTGGVSVIDDDAGTGGTPEMDAPILTGTGGDNGTGGAMMDSGAVMDTPPPMDTPPAMEVAPEAPAPEPFVCNHVMGGHVLGQFFPTMEAMLDNPHWQYVSPTAAYVNLWGDPNNALWQTAVMSGCAMRSATPDRVLLVVYNPMLTTETQFRTAINSAVMTIKAKFPGVKRIELLSNVRPKGNQACGGGRSPDLVVPAYVDAAIAFVAGASMADEVIAGPKIEADCAWFDPTTTDLAGTGIMSVGQLYADYYKLHP